MLSLLKENLGSILLNVITYISNILDVDILYILVYNQYQVNVLAYGWCE